MKYVFASRTGNVESIIDQLGLTDEAIRIDDGSESVDEEFIIFTYTDGYGDTPYEVEEFLNVNGDNVKGVVVSGDTSYGEAYCQAGDNIAEAYNCPVLYKVENDGTAEDIAAIKEAIGL